MSADEYKAMIELAKNAGPDECEMCGSIRNKIKY
jgi:ribonucleoside-diphosphate reductase alpha chain